MVVPREERPLIKRPVLYIGSAVPIKTTEGLEAIQEPLRERYPQGGQVSGVSSYLSIVPSGLLLQYKEDPQSTVISFPITSLTICAAVRRMRTVDGATGQSMYKFISLNSPQARSPGSNQPAIFTAITRRTKGRRVLECHGFICASDKDAMDLVSATSYVDQAQKRRSGSIKTNTPRPYSEHSAVMRVDSMMSTNGADITQNGSHSFTRQEQISMEEPIVRLIPGEEHQKVAPEFFEPPPSQGYFYGGTNVEVKTFNVEKTTENGTTEPPEPIVRPEVPNGVEAPELEPLVPPLQLPHGPPLETDVPRQVAHFPPRRPLYMPVRAFPPPPRARFFSPPPTFIRRIPVPYMMPPPPGMIRPPPPPGMMMGPPPPLLRRQHRRRSHSSGGSHSKSSSRGSSPKPEADDTEPKRVPNADLESESDVSFRPRTPPRDYDPSAPRQQRVSRRDEFEMRRKRDKSPKRKHASPRIIYSPYGPQYFPYPGYPYMPPYGGRSRSMPPPMNERHYSPSRRKEKKSKKNKKKSKQKGRKAPSDISLGSYGYHSEIPHGMYDNDGYSFYPPRPRDFRRIENQFMNEKSFSKRIQEESRKSKGKKENYYPTAYELNEALNDGKTPRDGDFTMY
ncbi:hypothetical protein KUTeg_010257 [Tegillarca granosa]|uniref:PID domain-containing protein n=1 Tax=Tegillarca granosa TaxID=220873 RepID=A0ABQ9F6D0_TEGGR|nr:hypothetical protein KUTeg_010257 [Tegillarca granosa]